MKRDPSDASRTPRARRAAPATQTSHPAPSSLLLLYRRYIAQTSPVPQLGSGLWTDELAVESKWRIPPDLAAAETLWPQYLFSLHWALATTLGNDTQPVNGAARAGKARPQRSHPPHPSPQVNGVQFFFGSLVMFLGLLLESAVVGSAASLILNLDQHHNEYMVGSVDAPRTDRALHAHISPHPPSPRQVHMDKLIGFLHHFRVPKEVTKKVCSYYSYLWECRYAKPDEHLFEALPQALRAQVRTCFPPHPRAPPRPLAHLARLELTHPHPVPHPADPPSQVDVSLKRQLVERVTLFQGLPLPCLVELVSRLVPLISLPDEYIILQGEVGQEVRARSATVVPSYRAAAPLPTSSRHHQPSPHHPSLQMLFIKMGAVKITVVRGAVEYEVNTGRTRL